MVLPESYCEHSTYLQQIKDNLYLIHDGDGVMSWCVCVSLIPASLPLSVPGRCRGDGANLLGSRDTPACHHNQPASHAASEHFPHCQMLDATLPANCSCVSQADFLCQSLVHLLFCVFFCFFSSYYLNQWVFAPGRCSFPMWWFCVLCYFVTFPARWVLVFLL